ncbi:Zinc finger C2H2 [Penicillium cinerascens]|uniref:Zinc finger C2H2 n=1 Tax=Penicillium cinerascens TaxID=70096 RepID=A0A9W9N9Q1_9EURO|nr:Zinc finger C2H2 [Penicillium cinerascens]KAJ5215827.1 Zinc finger C2H2 [Penicillium cinerascens]
MTKKDPLLAYTSNVVNLSDFDNSKIRRAVLPRTESDYKCALRIFDALTYKAFLVWAAKGKKGRIEAFPTVKTIQGFRRDFQAGMLYIRDINFSDEFSTTLHEFILIGLWEKVPLSTAKMDYSRFSPNDIIILLI